MESHGATSVSAEALDSGMYFDGRKEHASCVAHDGSMGRTVHLPSHEWLFFMVNVGKYTVRPMDPMGMETSKEVGGTSSHAVVVSSASPVSISSFGVFWAKPKPSMLNKFNMRTKQHDMRILPFIEVVDAK